MIVRAELHLAQARSPDRHFRGPGQIHRHDGGAFLPGRATACAPLGATRGATGGQPDPTETTRNESAANPGASRAHVSDRLGPLDAGAASSPKVAGSNPARPIGRSRASCHGDGHRRTAMRDPGRGLYRSARRAGWVSPMTRRSPEIRCRFAPMSDASLCPCLPRRTADPSPRCNEPIERGRSLSTRLAHDWLVVYDGRAVRPVNAGAEGSRLVRCTLGSTRRGSRS